MKRFFALFAFLLCLLGTANAQFTMSPTGNDNAAGTAAAPWLTPNHALTCGQTITAVPGNYGPITKFGVVSCPSGIGVAWLKCATFDACKISSTSNPGIGISNSFWGVAGFEVTTSSNSEATAIMTDNGINHIIIADNVVNGAMAGGINTNGGDYDIVVGNIVYNAAIGNAFCYSGISMWEPTHRDTLSGTPMYAARYILGGNQNAASLANGYVAGSCSGTKATDGEGVILDTFTGYTAQAVVENNMLVFNGGRGVEVNTTGPKFFLNHNTLVGNNAQPGQQFPLGLGELTMDAGGVTATGNLAVTTQAKVGTASIFAAAFGNSAEPNSNVSGNLFNGGTYNGPFGTNVTTTVSFLG